MKKLDLIRLINEKPYVKNNLQKDMHGIVVNEINPISVLFFNPKNIGNYAIVKIINVQDIIVEKEKLPKEIQQEIFSKLDTIISKANSYLEPITINEYDMVELIVEEEKYAKYGVHKGDTGCVMDNKAVQNYIEVDFSGIDEKGDFYGDCISVKIEDLRVIK